MPLEKYANDFATTLAGAVTSTTTTTLTVNDAAPAALRDGQFRVRVDNELMLVVATGANGASPWTVERGIEGTTAATHALLDIESQPNRVTHLLTVGSLALLKSGFNVKEFGAKGRARQIALLRPNADITNTMTLGGAATAFDALDDPVTQPTAADTGTSIFANANGTVTEVAMGTVPVVGAYRVTVWAYMETNADAYATVKLFKGATQLGATYNIGGAGAVAPGWHSFTYRGELAQADVDDLRVRFDKTGGTQYFAGYATYLEVEYADVDDSDAIQAAMAAASALGGGTIDLGGGDLPITEDIEVPAGVNLRGEGPDATSFLCLTAASGLRYGSGVVGGALAYHGRQQGFTVDGNLISTKALRVWTVNASFDSVDSVRQNGDSWVWGGQNSSFTACRGGDCNGSALAFDNGAGLGVFDGACGFTDSTGYLIELRQTGTSTAGAYPVPQYNMLTNGITERTGSPSFNTTNAGAGCLRQLAGAWNYFTRWTFYSTNGAAHPVKIQPNTFAGRSGDSNGKLFLNSCTLLGTGAAGQFGIDVDAVSGGVAGSMVTDVSFTLEGETVFSGLVGGMVRNGTTTPFFVEGPVTPYSGTGPKVTPNGTGAYGFWVSRLAPPSGWKPPCRYTTKGNLTLSGLTGHTNIDNASGTVVVGDRILAKDQTTASQNGPWIAAAGAWTRPVDFDANAQVFSGVRVGVTDGVLYEDSDWVLKTADPITLGTTALAFEFMSQAARTGIVQRLANTHKWTAGGTIAAGDVVMPGTVDGQVVACTVAAQHCGIAMNAATSGQTVIVAGPGSIVQAKKSATSVTVRGTKMAATTTAGTLAAGVVTGTIVGTLLNSPGTATTCWIMVGMQG